MNVVTIKIREEIDMKRKLPFYSQTLYLLFYRLD